MPKQGGCMYDNIFYDVITQDMKMMTFESNVLTAGKNGLTRTKNTDVSFVPFHNEVCQFVRHPGLIQLPKQVSVTNEF